MQRFTGLLRRCIDDYNMIEDGETIAVGVSGGKDSLALLCSLAALRRYYPKKFDLHAITLSMGFEGMDFSPVAELCADLGVPYTVRESELRNVIFEERQEKNPCALCAKMRRGRLHESMLATGISKVALGHHYDDAVETFFLSLFYENRLSCFHPVTYLDRMGVTQIRPMLYVSEGMVRDAAERFGLPVVQNTCPADGYTKRREVKELVARLGRSYPGVKNSVFTAMQRLPLEGWATDQELKRRPPTE